MAEKTQHAITPTRAENYPEWYQQVIKAADLAENSAVRGCMIIKPWGYGIWENIQSALDQRIKATGHENAYFPLFIPLSFFQREADHVEGFAKECAVVTHHRLEEREGRLVPTGELEEPLVVRPTSETIIGDAFAHWIQSYRDLPLLINQWANVVRWEMRPRLFLRTTEFLWQEGHTAHATREEAIRETLDILALYKQFAQDVLALPVFDGEKTEGERFPGADNTYCIEAMMQDGRALQAGTSHYLGQNFAKAAGIRFLNKEGALEFVYTTSWGVSTRLIGGVIMTHADDDGLRLPPRVAPTHAVILPITAKEDQTERVMNYAESIKRELLDQRYQGGAVRTTIDKRDIRGGEKSWQWVKKGIPLRIEVGPRDIDSDSVVVYRRDQGVREKIIIKRAELAHKIPALLDEIQQSYFRSAERFRDEHVCSSVKNFDEFKEFFGEGSTQIGFVRGKWCNDPKAEEALGALKVTVRCLPIEQSGTSGKCVVTGRDATVDALFAKAY